jgi:nucleoid DNA-binding protein
MDKRQLVETTARRSSLTQHQMSEAVDVVFAAIAEALAGGEDVVLRSFGRFSTWQRRQRVRGFDGQVYQIEQRRLVFRTSAALRRKLEEGNS